MAKLSYAILIDGGFIKYALKRQRLRSLGRTPAR